MLGDFITATADLVINGNVAMSPNAAVGATRNFNTAGGNLVINGILSGAAGSNVIKITGATDLVLNNFNTYQGTTTINAGAIVVGTNVAPNVAGALGISDTPIILGGGTLQTGGQVNVSRDINTTAASAIFGNQVETSVISGAIIDTNGITLEQVAAGQLDVQGAISGASTLTIAGANATYLGTVRLSSNTNGYSLNTFSGGTTLQDGRLVIAANTNFSGTATAPAILSGPLGTGALTFGAGNGNAGGGTILTDGADRVIVNALAPIASPANWTLNFAGNGSMLFTQPMDLNNTGTYYLRTFNVTTNPGVVTFSNTLQSSGIAGAGLAKSGEGTLLLSGSNTFTGPVSVTGGILSIGADANLGNAINTVSLSGGNGTLQVTGTFTTGRDFNNSAGGGQGIDVTGSNTFTISNSFVGGSSLTKLDTGTLVLGGAANVLTTINVFGGGTVQSTATGTLSNNLGTTSVVINGGTLSLTPSSGSTALTEPLVTYSGGSYLNLTANSSSLTELSATSLTGANGTLVIVAGSGHLGTTGTQQECYLAGNFNAASNVAGVGIVAPNIVGQLTPGSTAASFLTYDSVTASSPLRRKWPSATSAPPTSTPWPASPAAPRSPTP